LRRQDISDDDADTPSVAARAVAPDGPEDGRPFPDGRETGQDNVRPMRGVPSVPVHRPYAKKRARRRWPLLVYGAMALVAGMALFFWVRGLLLHDARFLLSPGSIQVLGGRATPQAEVVRVFAGDLGRSVLSVPLEKRRQQLEALPWVRRATVMRLWPDRLRVVLQERVPVAYARTNGPGQLDGPVRLVDAEGVLLDMPYGTMQRYSFPVLSGLSPGPPLPARKAEVQLYQQFMAALAAGGGDAAQNISEVDVSDPEDVRAEILNGQQETLVHFGDSDFLARYQAFLSYRAEWLRLCPQLASVDMRGGRRIVLRAAPGKACVADAPTAPGANGAAVQQDTQPSPQGSAGDKKKTGQGTTPRKDGSRWRKAKGQS
jgi:cell division protein FtsQ